MCVLLFDIDGTLIRSGGAGKAAMEDALRTEFGVTVIHDRVSYCGRTDPAIGADLLNVHGLEASAENIRRLKTAYLGHLPDCLRRHNGIVLPGVRSLLNRLKSAENVAVGLLTGNIREGARRKLTHFDLWHHFPFGGFADDIPERDGVARLALKETAKHLGREVNPSSVWVIGDTPHDVKCARTIGAKAVAVATGWHTVAELTAAKADWILTDLSDPAPLWREWGLER